MDRGVTTIMYKEGSCRARHFPVHSPLLLDLRITEASHQQGVFSCSYSPIQATVQQPQNRPLRYFDETTTAPNCFHCTICLTPSLHTNQLPLIRSVLLRTEAFFSHSIPTLILGIGGRRHFKKSAKPLIPALSIMPSDCFQPLAMLLPCYPIEGRDG